MRVISNNEAEEIGVAVSKMSLQQKVNVLKQLANELDVVITASYGASELIVSSDIDIATRNVEHCSIEKGKTVVISTSIMTG